MFRGIVILLLSCMFCCNEQTFEELNEPAYKVEVKNDG